MSLFLYYLCSRLVESLYFTIYFNGYPALRLRIRLFDVNLSLSSYSG